MGGEEGDGSVQDDGFAIGQGTVEDLLLIREYPKGEL